MTEPPITPAEFIQLASSEKVKLIERLAAQMLAKGYELAGAAFEYYRLDAVDKKSDAWAEARAKRWQFDNEYDALKHAVSALQSTLRAEREVAGHEGEYIE